MAGKGFKFEAGVAGLDHPGIEGQPMALGGVFEVVFFPGGLL